ncbi:uncharacterized protein TNCT_444911, partial [Trichonephila clavata]
HVNHMNPPIHIMAKPAFDDEDALYSWDNSTKTIIVPDIYNNKLYFFLMGLAFISGLVSGLILHWLYMYLLKYIMTHLEDNHSMSHGVINLSYIDDDSGPIHDPPPDYVSVMAEESAGGTPRLDRGMFGFLKRIFGRSSGEYDDGI